MSHIHDHLPDTPQDYATSLLSELLRAVWRDPNAAENEIPYRFDRIEGVIPSSHSVDLLADLPSDHLRLIGAAARELNAAAHAAFLCRSGLGPYRMSDEDPADREFPTVPSPGDDPGLRDYGEQSIQFRGRTITGHLFGPQHPWLAPGEAERLAADIQPHRFYNQDGYFSPACTAMVERNGSGEDCGLPADHPIHTQEPR